MSVDIDVNIDEKIKNSTKEPSNYHVVFLNDNVTPMEWVVQLLKDIFKHTQESAVDLTLSIHNEGSAVVGTYKYEIAEQKCVEAVNLSRNHGFPLQIKLEEE